MIKTIVVSLMMCLIELAVIVIASPLAMPSLILRFLPDDIREAAKDHQDHCLSISVYDHSRNLYACIIGDVSSLADFCCIWHWRSRREIVLRSV